MPGTLKSRVDIFAENGAGARRMCAPHSAELCLTIAVQDLLQVLVQPTHVFHADVVCAPHWPAGGRAGGRATGRPGDREVCQKESLYKWMMGKLMTVMLGMLCCASKLCA